MVDAELVLSVGGLWGRWSLWPEPEPPRVRENDGERDVRSLDSRRARSASARTSAPGDPRTCR